MTSRHWSGLAAVGAILYWLTAARPLVAEPWQWADDGLFLLHGERLVQWIGHPMDRWLGPYDPILLSKPPAFGLWLALVHLSRIPLRVAEFALLLPLPILFRRAVRPLVDLKGWRFLLVTVLIVGVPSLPAELRLLRTGLQAFAAAGALICSIAVVLRFSSARSQCRWAALLGAFFALAYLNREESPWLVPSIGGALLTGAIASWRAGDRHRVLFPALACAVAAGAPIGTVSLLNGYHYGLFATSSRRASGFVRLHETLTRLQPQHHERYVPVSTRARARAYSLSPSFARLRPYLDGPPGDEMARSVEYNALAGRPPGSREFYATFGWALLCAAHHAGAHDAAAAERLFGAAADELDAAIRSGDVRAGRGGWQTLAAPVDGDGRRVVRSTLRSALLLVSAAGTMPPAAPLSSGWPDDVKRMGDLTHATLAPREPASPSPAGEVLRRKALALLMSGLRLVYPASLAAVLGCIGWALVPRHRSPDSTHMALAGLLLIGALVAFCLTIALYDVFSLPHLTAPGSYNRLGYTPVSVLAAYAVAAASFVFDHGVAENAGSTG